MGLKIKGPKIYVACLTLNHRRGLRGSTTRAEVVLAPKLTMDTMDQ